MSEELRKSDLLIPVHTGEYLAMIPFHKQAGFLLVIEGLPNQKFGVAPGHLNVPTETIEETDMFLEQVIKRVIAEEIGASFSHLFAHRPSSYTKKGPTHLLLSEFTGDPTLIKNFEPQNKEEIIGYQWFKPYKLKNIKSVLSEETHGQLLSWIYPALISMSIGRLFRQPAIK